MVLKLLIPSWMLFHSESLKFIYAVTNWSTSDLSLWWRHSSKQILCWWSSVTWSVSSRALLWHCGCVCSGGPVWSGPQVWNVLAAATGTLQMRTRINWWKLHPPPSCWPKWWRTPSGMCTRYVELVKIQLRSNQTRFKVNWTNRQEATDRRTRNTPERSACTFIHA